MLKQISKNENFTFNDVIFWLLVSVVVVVALTINNNKNGGFCMFFVEFKINIYELTHI